ncbi:MAG: glycosyltransferase [Candidatus Taylorbacteria bacterium]
MISIIIPTYNEEKAIGDTIKRLMASNGYEIIISDDKSTDNTVSIAQSVVSKYSDNPDAMARINILANEHKHISIAQNRNTGAKVAHGDFLVFMDSDCVVENIEASFAKAISIFEKNPKIVSLTGAIGVLPEYETLGDKIVYSVFNLVHRIKNNILHTGESSGKFQMMRRSAFDTINGFREDLVTREDGDMFYRLSKIGRTLYVPDIIIRHTGRRAHQLGWPKLLSIWMIETFWVMLFDKSRTKTWKDIR